MIKVNVIPNYGKILVMPDKAESKTPGGIIVPDSSKDIPKSGTVVAVSEDHKDYPRVYKVGDRVLYSQYTGSEVKAVTNLNTEVKLLLMPQLEPFGKIVVKPGEPIVEIMEEFGDE